MGLSENTGYLKNDIIEWGTRGKHDYQQMDFGVLYIIRPIRTVKHVFCIELYKYPYLRVRGIQDIYKHNMSETRPLVRWIRQIKHLRNHWPWVVTASIYEGLPEKWVPKHVMDDM